MLITRRFSVSTICLVVLVGLATGLGTSAGPGRGAALAAESGIGNVVGTSEQAIMERLDAAFTANANGQLRLQEATALDTSNRIVLRQKLDLVKAQFDAARAAAADADRLLRELEGGAEFNETTDPSVLAKLLNEAAARTAFTASDLDRTLANLDKTRPKRLTKELQAARRSAEADGAALRAGFAALHGLPRAGDPSVARADDADALRLAYVLDFQSSAARKLFKSKGLPQDATDARARVTKAKARHATATASPSKRTKKDPRTKNRILAFRAKNKRVTDGSLFFNLTREWRGPFEFGFTGGVFRDDPDPRLYRGDTFVGMEVDREGVASREFFSANVRYVANEDAGADGGVQVFAASHVGEHGTLFFRGIQRVDVKVVFEDGVFEMFARPAGASAASFLRVGAFAAGGQDAVWIGGIGAANLAGKTELGIDDVYARALGGEPTGGGGTDGGGGDGIGQTASAVVDGAPFVAADVRVNYSRLLKRLLITLTNAKGDKISITSEDDVEGPGTYRPRFFGTSLVEKTSQFSIRGFQLVTGTGVLVIEVLDFKKQLISGSFTFDARDNTTSAKTTRSITQGAFRADDDRF